jgi:DNA-binding response OmpR family regulator
VAKKKILAIDDDSRTLVILNEMFLDQYEVRLVHDGFRGLTLAAVYKPDIVLLDIMLPTIDGYEVCRRMKQDPDLSNACVIMVSGKADAVDRQRAYEAGADDYVTKPFSAEELQAKLDIISLAP